MKYPSDGHGRDDAGLLNVSSDNPISVLTHATGAEVDSSIIDYSQAVATQGPIAVAMYSSWALPFYTTGTYVGTGCK